MSGRGFSADSDAEVKLEASRSRRSRAGSRHRTYVSVVLSRLCVLVSPKSWFLKPCFCTLLPSLEEDYNSVVETLVTKELLLNFGLELKKLRDELY